jgi:hypothetical protein
MDQNEKHLLKVEGVRRHLTELVLAPLIRKWSFFDSNTKSKLENANSYNFREITQDVE